jgi:prolipoprotein diacylglyceryltransferase
VFPILQIGPFALQTPGLMVLLGLWVGLTLAERRAPWHDVNPDNLYNLTLIGLVAGAVGARLIYFAQFPSAFSANPWSLLSPNPGLFDPLGGLVTGVIAAWAFGQRVGLTFWPTLDALTPALAVFAVSLGLSHLASGDAYGVPTDLPWSIDLWGTSRHPTQIYEILIALSIFAWIWWQPAPQSQRSPGQLFLQFIALSAGGRIFLEAFRGDSPLLPNGLRTMQLIAWLILAVSLWGISKRRAAASRGPTGDTAS